MLDAVWQALNRRIPDRRALCERHGWPDAAFARIERWKGLRDRYFFPAVADLEVLAAPDFELMELSVQGYAMGECFPRLLLRKRR